MNREMCFVTVFPTTPTHKPSSNILGCHLDAYGHQLRALSSQLLLDGSFESEQSNGSSSLLTRWTVTAPAGTVGLDAVHKMHGKKSMRFATRAGVGASIANRGQFGHGLARIGLCKLDASRYSCLRELRQLLQY